MSKEKNKNSVSVVWSVDDIRSMGYTCTDAEGMEVLEAMIDNHDANFGINWATLDNWCEAFNLKLKT